MMKNKIYKVVAYVNLTIFLFITIGSIWPDERQGEALFGMVILFPIMLILIIPSLYILLTKKENINFFIEILLVLSSIPYLFYTLLMVFAGINGL